MTYTLGVDLGTACLAAAVAGPDGVRTVALGEATAAVSAVVHVGDGGVVAIGDRGEQRALEQPDGTLRGLRQRLGDATVLVDGAAYTVSALLAAQLRGVLRRVVDAEGGRPERVVLTVPASWDAARRSRFAEVATAAGIAAPMLVTEAEAAVVAVGDRVRDDAVVAVYDLGAGFHATLVRRGAEEVQVLGTPEDDERIGGLAFDDAVLALVGEAVAAAGASVAAVGDPRRAASDPAALARLHRDCVRAKEALATAPEAVVPVHLPDRTLEVRLTRAGLEERVRESVEATMWALSRTIRSADLLPSDVAAVLLLGGSSRMPLVRELLVQQFGRPVLADVHPKDAVAVGAAMLGRAAPAPVAAPVPAAPLRAEVRAGATRPDAARPNGSRPGGSGLAGPPEVDPVPAAVEPRHDPPTHLIVVPRTGADGPPPALDEERPWWSRVGLPVAAAAVAVLVLVGSFLLASRGTSPPAGPASGPPPAPASTTVAPTTPPPTTTSAPTTASRPRVTTARPTRSRAARPSAPRTTRPRPATPTTRPS